MPSLVVSLTGKPQATYAIDRPCMRIGRSSANDIVLDSPTVSSVHAMLVVSGDGLAIEDLGSSNGTFLGARRVERANLEDGSIVSIGDFALKLVADRKAMAYEPTMLVRPGAAASKAFLQRLDGTRRGDCIELTKVVTTIGKPGECMVTVIRRGDDFAVRFAEGPRPLLNGTALADAPVGLNAGDVLEMGAGRLQFLLQEPGARPQESADRPAPLDQAVPVPAPVAAPAPATGPLSWLRRALSRPAAERESRSQESGTRTR